MMFEQVLCSKYNRSDGMARWAADLLKRPAVNHSDQFQGYVERFVFDDTALQALGEVFGDAKSREDAWRVCHVPVVPCFISTPNQGWMIHSQDQKTMVSYYTSVHHWGVCHAGSMTLEGVLGHEVPEIRRSVVPLEDAEIQQAVVDKLLVVVFLLVALTQSRVATVRKITKKSGSTAAMRAFQRRRAQLGKPVYSYNRVQMNFPKTSLQKGEVAYDCRSGPKRAHWVIGHWRLIDGVIEPYWTWIDGHKSGDEELGFVTKERHVKIARSFRRGYMLPGLSGLPGERIRAVKK